jgi:hypothetical protein
MKRIVLAAGVLAIGFAALAQSAFEGVWKVKDTAGHPFEITLSSGGAAKPAANATDQGRTSSALFAELRRAGTAAHRTLAACRKLQQKSAV